MGLETGDLSGGAPPLLQGLDDLKSLLGSLSSTLPEMLGKPNQMQIMNKPFANDELQGHLAIMR